MTRGQWVALGGVVAAIAVLIPYGPAVWRAVAYVEERIEPIDVRHRYSTHRYSTNSTEVNTDLATLEVEYMVVLRKRLEWLPGPDLVVRCAWCVESDHARCPGSNFALSCPAGTRDSRFIGTVHCDCPHPSHAEGSE